MAKLKSGIPLPIVGLSTGQPGEFIDPRGTPSCQNISLGRSVLEKRLGTEAMGITMSERVLALAELQIEQDTYFLRMGPTKVELLNKSTNVWSDVCPVASALTGSDSSTIDWTITNIGGSRVMAFTNGIDAIRQYTGSGNSAVLGGSPPLAKYIIQYGSYLLLAYITDGGNIYESRVQWSDTGDPENWTSGNYGASDLLDDAEPITGLGLFGDYVTVHKDYCIYLGYLVSTDDVIRFDRKATGAGAAADSTIQQLPTGEQIFLSKSGFRIFNGTTAMLINNDIQDEIRETLNSEYLYKAWSIMVRERDEYWCGIPIGSQTEADTVYVYNYRTGQIYKDYRPNTTAAGLFLRTNQLTWDDKTNTWDSDTTIWNSVQNLSLNPVVAFGDSTGLVTKRVSVYNDNGTAIDAYWESKDYTATDLEAGQFDTILRWIGMELWAKGDSLDVAYSIDGGTNWVDIDTFELESYYPTDSAPIKIYFDVVSSSIRFRFRNNTAGESFSIKKFIMDVIPRESRT